MIEFCVVRYTKIMRSWAVPNAMQCNATLTGKKTKRQRDKDDAPRIVSHLI